MSASTRPAAHGKRDMSAEACLRLAIASVPTTHGDQIVQNQSSALALRYRGNDFEVMSLARSSTALNLASCAVTSKHAIPNPCRNAYGQERCTGQPTNESTLPEVASLAEKLEI